MRSNDGTQGLTIRLWTPSASTVRRWQYDLGVDARDGCIRLSGFSVNAAADARVPAMMKVAKRCLSFSRS